MEKNSRIELGKTPSEDGEGESCRKIIQGKPVTERSNNCFDKVANLMYKHSCNEFKEVETKDSKSGSEGS